MKKERKEFYVSSFGSNIEHHSRYRTAAAWVDEDVCFNLSNSSYSTLHTHEYYEFLCILSGSVIHKINGTAYVMGAGSCCLVRPNDCHCLEVEESSAGHQPYLNITFICQKDYFQQLLNAFGDDVADAIHNTDSPLSFSISSSFLAEIRQTCLRIQTMSSTPEKINVLICEALIAKLFCSFVISHFSSAQDEYPEWLQTFILSLHDSSNFHKSLEELTAGIPYSYSYIQKQFKFHLGTSIISYFNSVKMSFAKNLLVNTNTPVSEIALQLDFDSVAHLNHLFKKAYGLAPTALRKQRKEHV